MLTADEYYAMTGIMPPADFEPCLAYAKQIVDANTLYAYVGRDMNSMPSIIRITYKQALAMQTMAISQRGGIDAASEPAPNSVQIGKFSYSGGTTEVSTRSANDMLSPAVRALLPLLLSYGRGMRS